MRGYYQHDENDCGLACVLSVCKWLNINVDEKKIRQSIYLGKEGLSLYAITELLKKEGVQADAVEGAPDELYHLLETSRKPIIVMVYENTEFHYMILHSIKRGKLLFWDPNKGKRILFEHEFELIWSGYAIEITDVYESKSEKIPHHYVVFDILKKQRKYLILIFLFSILSMTVGVSVTFFYRSVMDQIQYINDSFKLINALFAFMGACYLLMMLLSYVKGRLEIYLDKELEMDINHQYLSSIFSLSIQKKEDYGSGGILDRYHRLSHIVNTMTSTFTSIILEAISLVVGAVIMICIDRLMFGMVLIIVASYFVAFFIAKTKLFVLSKAVMDRQSILITNIKEIIQNLLTLKSFDSSPYQVKIFDKMSDLKEKEYTLNKLSMSISVLLDAVENIVMLLILAYGIHSIISGKMSLGTLLAFETFIGFFLSPVKNILGILPSLQEMILTFRRVEDIFILNDHCDTCEDKSNKSIMIKLLDVDISYGFDAPILENIGLEISKSETCFMVGASGSGKSSLAKTMAGILNHSHGLIYYNGKSKVDISNKMLYLSQDPEIFSGSIKDNILMWKENYDTDLFEEVLDIVGINNMLHQRHLTIYSQLLENGTNLSGGEKQRIAIARALMHDTGIYFFDEATCHLDAESEQKIMSYLRNKMKEKTCIFISHNAKLLEEEDNVIFLDESGRIHKKKHIELLRNIEYQRLLSESS